MATAKRRTKSASSNGHARNGHTSTYLASKYKRTTKRKLVAAATNVKKAAIKAKDKFDDIEENVQKYAKINPWKTMGLTLLAGVVVGRIFNHRK